MECVADKHRVTRDFLNAPERHIERLMFLASIDAGLRAAACATNQQLIGRNRQLMSFPGISAGCEGLVRRGHTGYGRWAAAQRPKCGRRAEEARWVMS